MESLHEDDEPNRVETTPASIAEAFHRRLTYSLARDEYNATNTDAAKAVQLTVRDKLIDRWFATQRACYWRDVKRVYYLSMEFLLGRLLTNNLMNLGISDEYDEALRGMGYELEDLAEHEVDSGLGNGGLGRLAACFLDSAATLDLPFYGYGIRYEYGSFRQEIVDGQQVEAPDGWLRYGNPWEIARPDVVSPVKFYGRAEHYTDDQHRRRVRWVDTEDVLAMAYDLLIPGYRTNNVNSLRLWAAKSTADFDLGKFHSGEYVAAVQGKSMSENISRVLYPPDSFHAGRELRLKQEYFFTSATIQDIIRRFRKRFGRRHSDVPVNWEDLPDKAIIQLNDTHPAIAIPEVIRVLVDDEGVDWDVAWSICQRLFAYTNHTVLPEALESWPSDLLRDLLPRHMEIIEEIERRFRAAVRSVYPGDERRLHKVAIINDATGNVRMAHLAIVGSLSVNGVAKMHTRILQDHTFADFHQMYPGKFVNQTNGITPRRWLAHANPGLRALLDETAGEGWLTDPERWRTIERFASDEGFAERWRHAKREAKIRCSNWMRAEHGAHLDPDSLFDVQVKRIHEYKRQLLNVMRILALRRGILDGTEAEIPRVIIFGGKAAPDYHFAKMLIALIHDVANLISVEPALRDILSVVFVPNYGVSIAELLFPATDLSEQISTAGMEASGTGCMKGVMNGAVLIGTVDGANPEIFDEVGAENAFIFGHTAEEIEQLRRQRYDPMVYIDRHPVLAHVIDDISNIAAGRYGEIAHMLRTSDRYFHCADFDSYLTAQSRAAAAWSSRSDWTRMSILNCARSGRFSSDQTISAYARDIWKVRPMPVREL